MIDRVIFDLCAGTGSWSEPYVRAGYKVYRVTLPENDVFEWEPPCRAYGILAAPACTDFSKVNPRRNPVNGFPLVRRCLEIIWQSNPKFWALENPRGDLAKFLGYPGYSFDPFDFGYPYSKRTWVWGYFKRPKKGYAMRSKYVRGFEEMKISDFRAVGLKGKNSSDVRSCTPPVFADAFFRANQ